MDDDRPGDEAKFTLPPPAGAEVAVFRSRQGEGLVEAAEFEEPGPGKGEVVGAEEGERVRRFA